MEYKCRRCDKIVGDTPGDAEAHEMVHHHGQKCTYPVEEG